MWQQQTYNPFLEKNCYKALQTQIAMESKIIMTRQKVLQTIFMDGTPLQLESSLDFSVVLMKVYLHLEVTADVLLQV